MHQSPQKLVARHRDRQVEFDAMEEEAERKLYRAAPPKARKFPLRDEVSWPQKPPRAGPSSR